MITPANIDVVTEFQFINRHISQSTITGPSGKIYNIQRVVPGKNNTWEPFVDLGMHFGPLRCETKNDCLVWVAGYYFNRITNGNKEFILDGQICHDLFYHPESINETVMQKFKTFLA